MGEGLTLEKIGIGGLGRNELKRFLKEGQG
jgi:hypothetical protein